MEHSLSSKIQSFVSQAPEQELVSSINPPEKTVDTTCGDARIPINTPDTVDLEIMLREQLSALNNLATRFISRANACVTSTHQVNIAERYANTGIRLVNAIRTGMETLSKLQNKGKQQITVQHIHVAGDAKALIAGSINKTGGGSQDNLPRGEDHD